MVSSTKEWDVFLCSRFKIYKQSVIYFKSSIWPGIRMNLQTVIHNSGWQIGNGESISFWLDSWNSLPLVDQFQIPAYMHKSLHSSVADYMVNSRWCIPATLLDIFPGLGRMLADVDIPLSNEPNQLIWKNSPSGFLSFKEGFTLFEPNQALCNWTKLIWNRLIPPSKSFVAWKLVHNRIPTNDQMQKRGCMLASIYCICHSAAETADNIFLNCRFATDLCNWLGSVLNLQIDRSSIMTVFSIWNKS